MFAIARNVIFRVDRYLAKVLTRLNLSNKAPHGGNLLILMLQR